LCRWGGEEFAVLLPNGTLRGAHRVAEDLRSTMPAGSTCSVGVAEGDFAEPRHVLLDRADRRLHDARSAGRNRTHV
jgi:diguanylate cyclase